MPRHLVQHDSIKLKDGKTVNIKYWAEDAKICVAAFDDQDNQVSVVVYSAEADMADSFYPAFKESIIDSLAATVKNDLAANPELHYCP